MSQLEELQKIANPTLVKQGLDDSTHLERIEPFTDEEIEELENAGWDVLAADSSMFSHAIEVTKKQ